MSGATFEGTVKTCVHGTLAGSFCAQCETEKVIEQEQEARAFAAPPPDPVDLLQADPDEALRVLLAHVARAGEGYAGNPEIPIDATVAGLREAIVGLKQARAFISGQSFARHLAPELED